jgi:16S rRNA processing protein RimM
VVGRVVRAHGLRGELLVEPLTDNPERFAVGGEVELAPPAPAVPSARGAPGRTLRVAASRPHKGGLLVRFEGVDDRDAAEVLRGAELSVARGLVPAAPEGAYYHFELLGCRCHDARLGDLGEVVELVDDGGGLLLVVDDGRRRLPVPFVARFLRSVDVAGGRIETELPEGLDEICGSGS